MQNIRCGLLLHGYIDRHSVVCVSVCLCLLVTTVSPTTTNEPINMTLSRGAWRCMSQGPMDACNTATCGDWGHQTHRPGAVTVTVTPARSSVWTSSQVLTVVAWPVSLVIAESLIYRRYSIWMAECACEHAAINHRARLTTQSHAAADHWPSTRAWRARIG